MKIYNSLEEIDHIEETVVALGNFDGVHKGHQEIIRRCVNAALCGRLAAYFKIDGTAVDRDRAARGNRSESFTGFN